MRTATFTGAALALATMLPSALEALPPTPRAIALGAAIVVVFAMGVLVETPELLRPRAPSEPPPPAPPENPDPPKVA